MLADLFLSVANAVISYTIDKLDPAETLKTWLKRDPAKLAFQKALARAYAAFARQYPEYAASLFDQSFLSKEAVPEISKLLIRSQHPDPALLAHAWGISIGFDTHSEFCKRATKPASDFLSWLEAELKAEQAFQALFDSRTLDSLPKIEAEIEKLTKELTRGLDAASKIASEYEKISINIGGDVIDSNIIIGDNNTINKYYYSGGFVSLNEYYIEPDSVFQRVRVDEFVGRDWLTAKVDDLLNDPKRKSGAFLLVGDAGVGKTSFMAHLVKERRYIHLFAEQVPGQAMLQRALQSLGSQLVTRYQIDPYKDRDTLTQLAVFPDFLERLLRLAASTLTHGEKIVIVCDALDEAGTFPDGNVFGLPNVLPDGVYFILSQRPVNTKLPNFEPLRFDLEAQGADNLEDMQTYLSAVAQRSEVALQIRSKEYSEAFFIQTLQEKSLGVWMYLHYIIKEIENGSRAPLDLENLPTGLIGYYADYWDDWRYGRKGRGKGEEAWNNLYSPLLTTLAAAQEAITVEQLIKWSNAKASPREVTHLLNQSWRSFITKKEVKKNKIYSPYHLSFRDFITGRADFDKLDPKRESLVRDLAEQTVEAHGRIVKTFEEECKGEWEKLVKQDYPRLHLSAHIAGAGQYEKLINLLTEGDEHIQWAEARYQKEETYSGYISDLTYVWEYAEQEQNYALAIRCMLIENSIHSMASNVSPELLVQLAKAGLWSYLHCLSSIQDNSESDGQAKSLELLAPDLPQLLFQKALTATREIKTEYMRTRALVALAPRLTDELKTQALATAHDIKDEYMRTRALVALAPHLTDELKTQALAGAREIKDEYYRVDVLTALAPHLTDELKTQALAGTREIKNEYARAIAFAALAPHLTDELKTQVLQEALVSAHEIEAKSDRAFSLVALAPHLTDELKIQALAGAREIKDESDRAHVLAALAPHLTNELKTQVLQEALATTREIKDESDRFFALAVLAPHLTDELKTQALAAACEIKDESDRVRALAVLAPHLTYELKTQALVAVRGIKAEYFRVRALSALAPHLTDELKSQALSVAREIKGESGRVHALSTLAPLLTGEFKTLVLQEMLATTHDIKDKYLHASALVALAPHLTDELKTQLLQEALAAAHEIKDESDLVYALAALVPHLTDELRTHVLQEALTTACKIKDESGRAFTLVTLAPHLMTDELKTQALVGAREIKDESDRVRALAALAPHLTDELKTHVLQEALTSACEIKNESYRAFSLVALAPHLMTDELKTQALVGAREIKDESDHVRALAAFAPHLIDELKTEVLQEVLAAACEIKYEPDRAVALVALAPHLMTDELKTQALAAAREIKYEPDRVDALVALAPHLTDELKTQVLQEALVAARGIKAEYVRVHALVTFAPYLTHELKTQMLHEALTATRKIKDEYLSADALAALAPHLDDALKTQILQKVLHLSIHLSNSNLLSKVLSTWKEIEFRGLKESIIPFVRSQSQQNRSNGTKVLGEIIPSLVYFSGKEITHELLISILDTARWWP